MAEKLLRTGQAVYAADGTYLGRLLQCDARFMVIGKSRWRPDHWLVANEDVAATDHDAVILRTLPDSIRPETAEAWWPPSDRIGNANGVDLEPLRAGMAEMLDKSVGVVPLPSPAGTSRPEPPLPSPEDVDRLDRERLDRIEAVIDRYIAAEIEDLEIDAACASPPGFEHCARYDTAFGLDRTGWIEEQVRAGAQRSGPPGGPGFVTPPPAPPVSTVPAPASTVGAEASRSAAALGRLLREQGFSAAEAEAIASGGFEALARLRHEISASR